MVMVIFVSVQIEMSRKLGLQCISYLLVVITSLLEVQVSSQNGVKSSIGSYVHGFYESNDKIYNKTYYVSTSFRAGWMGGYTWCRANDLDLMTFDSQDEHDKFIENILVNRTYYAPILPVLDKWGKTSIRMTMGTYQNHVKKLAPNGFVSYQTGEPVYPKITYKWIPNQPETYQDTQWCNTIESPNASLVGLNDFWCDTDTGLRMYPICQEMFQYRKGMNSKL